MAEARERYDIGEATNGVVDDLDHIIKEEPECFLASGIFDVSLRRGCDVIAAFRSRSRNTTTKEPR